MPENYEVIDFEKFLLLKLSLTDVFIDLDIKKLRDKLKSKYSNDDKCFSDFGTLQDFEFNNLLYYQKEIGINGPKNNQLDEPVSILKFGNNNILWNGYHRALSKITSGDKFIQGYLIDITNYE